jgi:2-oxoisovalerate dehydrogenase E1 component
MKHRLHFTEIRRVFSTSDYIYKRGSFRKDIEGLAEHRASQRLQNFLLAKTQQTDFKVNVPLPPVGGYSHIMTDKMIRISLDAALATFCLHTESRIASMIGHGFYTIGPCGEEALASAGCVIEDHDSVALHYRHLAINIARQLCQGVSLEQILLDRARGYTVSKNDPVTGGVHCSIGSKASRQGSGDFVVTSTLASQCPSAVGRALGYSLRKTESDGNEGREVSFVTLGDGSIHNHHFWSAFHLSRHARHKRIKCPIVFGISDNGLSISYKTAGYVDTLFANDNLIPRYCANGNDIMDVYSQTKDAISHSRSKACPVVLLYTNLCRRFGHAATDRQSAYLDADDINVMADNPILESTIQQVVEVFSVMSYNEVNDRLKWIQSHTLACFETASKEEKVTREDMLQRNSAHEVKPVHYVYSSHTAPATQKSEKKDVLRKHITRVIAEVMSNDDTIVYLGEDVRHGGYYLVTDGLKESFPTRILDFPPDETSLLGAAMGFAQVGLTPIVEIPYAKYLDCGADMFYEIAISNWLTNGKLPNGMIIRLQGFDRGVFGGNFHTTNMLPHSPPGVDMVCFSNGIDYVKGFRNAVLQARAGRIVVFVDSTHLLNLRHLHGKDQEWECHYPGPGDSDPIMAFDRIRRYGESGSSSIVTYGNGVVTALQSRRELVDKGIFSREQDIDIIDCPYLSSAPKGLASILPQYESVLFADICKEGPGSGPLASMAAKLHADKFLMHEWSIVAAPRCYNPLGSTCTFLSISDVTNAMAKLTKQRN